MTATIFFTTAILLAGTLAVAEIRERREQKANREFDRLAVEALRSTFVRSLMTDELLDPRDAIVSLGQLNWRLQGSPSWHLPHMGVPYGLSIFDPPHVQRAAKAVREHSPSREEVA